MLNWFPGRKYGVAAEQLDCVSPFKAPLLETPGADADGDAGGSQPSDEGADGNDESATGDEAPPAEPEREEALADLLVDDDEDDTDENDESGQPKPKDARYAKLAKKNRKLRRQVTRLLPQLERIKGLDIDDLITRARNHESLERTIQANPRLRALLYGADEAETKPAGGKGKAEPEEEEFDESKLPFDPEANASNRYFANLAKQNFEQRKAIKTLQTRLDDVAGKETQRTKGEQQRAETSVRNEWMSAIDGAAAHIKDEDLRDVFKDAMRAAYRDPKGRELGVQRIAAHYLKKFKVDPTQAKKANAAADAAGKKPNAAATQQRIAENNRNAPRTVAPSGTPAPARAAGELLSDVRRRLTGARR